MAYEYEESLKNRLLKLELDDYVEVIQLEKEYEELKEVYAKARAFDGIINIKYDFVNHHGLYPSDEDCIKELEDIIRKYKEDK